MACSVLPEEAFRSQVEVVKNATAIRLVVLESAALESEVIRYSFRVLDSIKGSDKERYELKLSGNLPGSTVQLGDHSQYDFWTHSMGGTRLSSYCKIRPSFQIQHQYLVFEVEGQSQIAFEQIVSDSDRWLNFVRQTVDDGQQLGPVLSIRELLDQFSSIHIYDCPTMSPPRESAPRLVSSIRGGSPENSPIPQSVDGFSCLHEEQFAYLGSGTSNKYLLVPIRNEVLELSQLARGLELVPKNRISLKEIQNMD